MKKFFRLPGSGPNMMTMWPTCAIVIFFFAIVAAASAAAASPFASFMSEAFQWTELTATELKGWYSEQDLCMLKSAERIKFPRDVRMANCSREKGWHRGKGCAVGMGNKGDPCYMPFTARRSFKKGVKGYTDPTTKPLSEAFAALAKTNTTLVLLGDSTTRQKLQAMECAVWREDWRNDFHWIGGARNQVLPCKTRVKVSIPAKNAVADILIVSIGPNSVGCMKHGLQKRDGFAGGIFENARNLTARVMLEQRRNVLVVANIGLWYNTVESFQQAAPPILDWLVSISRAKGFNNVVAWHETMRQHWMNHIGSGYFDKVVVDDFENGWKNGSIDWFKDDVTRLQVPNCCHEITNHDPSLDWRNWLVKNYVGADADRGQRITLLPFSDITKGAPDMHTCHPMYKHDCTHYCYWPTLWQPFWTMLQRMTATLKVRLNALCGCAFFMPASHPCSPTSPWASPSPVLTNLPLGLSLASHTNSSPTAPRAPCMTRRRAALPSFV